MIQQLTSTRSDKQLTKNDIGRIAYASCLNLFHTNSMFKPWPFGIAFSIDYYYVKRLNNNSYQYQYSWGSTDYSSGTPSPKTMSKGCNDIVTKNQSEIEALHPDLVCNKDGEERLLIISAYGATQYTRFNKSKLGFLIFEPNFYDGVADNSLGNFFYKLVITLKPGLFPLKNE